MTATDVLLFESEDAVARLTLNRPTVGNSINIPLAANSGEWRAQRARRHGPFEVDQAALEKARTRLENGARLQPAALAAVELMASSAAIRR